MIRKVIRPILAVTRDDLLKVQQQPDFLQQISLRQVEKVWQELQKVLMAVIFYTPFEDEHIEACASLGQMTDDYLTQLQESGRLLDALVADRLCMQLLLKLYQVLEDAAVITPGKSFSYAFPEDPEVIGSILEHTGADIRQKESGLMVPLKSAAYLLYPVSGQAADSCGGVCASCGNENCPYANKEKREQKGAFRYSYGYQQIFGTMPKDEKEQT